MGIVQSRGWLLRTFRASLAVLIFLSIGTYAMTGVPIDVENILTAPHHEELFAAQDHSIESIWDGIYTEDQAKRGKAIYMRECASCHLDDLLGDGMAPELVGVSFTYRWTDLSVGDIFATLQTTMPQGAPASLPGQAYIDIVAFLLEVNDYPVGGEELLPDLSALEKIMIEEK